MKCSLCGLVNFASASECKRCGASLLDACDASAATVSVDVCAFEGDADDTQLKKPRRLIARIGWVLGMTCTIVIVLHVSLLVTSRPADLRQRLLVRRAVELLDERGFKREALLLRHAANFRTTDNWWNLYVGHADAYASTNFPFEVVTLYPEFFNYPIDDTERAVILLHEARHLAGSGEEDALRSVWRDKQRLGWTGEKYGQTRVWKNVTEFTRRYAPQFFTCGEDGQQDCLDASSSVAQERR
jgi:hypothetical protein